MLPSFSIALRDPLLRLAVSCIVLTGAVGAMLVPFQSIIAIEELGITPAVFAAINAAGAVMAMLAAIYVGILCDQTGRYRALLLMSQCFGLVGLAALFWIQTPMIYAILYLIVLPISSTGYTQYYALAALSAQQNPDLDKDTGLGLARASFAMSFGLVPPIWAFAVARGADLMLVYGIAAIVQGLILLIALRAWPERSRRTAASGSGLSFGDALKELWRGAILIRLVLVFVAMATVSMYNIVAGLIIVNDLEAGPANVPIFVGVVALIEIPAMLLAPALMKRVRRLHLIALGVGVHSGALIIFAFAPSMAVAWLTLLPFGIGAGIVLSVPLGYVQDLVAHRPGAGSALLSITHTGSTVFASLVFALATIVPSYGFVALISAAAAIAAILGLLVLDRSRPL